MKKTRQYPWRGTMAIVVATIVWGMAAPVARADDGADSDVPSPEEQAKLRDTVAGCRARFQEVDAQVDKAGVRDAGYYRVPGYPYMRSDRLLASFAVGELTNMEPLGDWLHQLRDNEGFARDIELQNLGVTTRERITLLSELRLCAVWLSQFELGDAASREQLVTLVQIPREGVTQDKKAGRRGDADMEKEIERRADRVRARFAVPTTELQAPGTLVLWKVKSPPLGSKAVADGFTGAVRDALGRVGLTEDQWENLARRFAPSLLIETADKLDRIGSPKRGDSGPFVDVSIPVVDFQADYARLGTQSLIQFNYFVWFPGRTEEGAGDATRSRVDGLIWRVTLDAEGRPLAYDTIHASGFDHLWFPLASLHLRRDVQDGTVLTPQVKVPERFVVRLGHGSHDVRRLVAGEDVRASEVQEYDLQRYEKLLTLPLPGGGTGSLFGPDGAITGTPSAPSVPSGARIGPVRQWGHHPLSVRADLYFDDPRLLETYFGPPLSGHQQTTESQASQLGG